MTKNEAGTPYLRRADRIRAVYGPGPSSNVRPTDFGTRAGPAGRNVAETTFPEVAPDTTISSPGAPASENWGFVVRAPCVLYTDRTRGSVRFAPASRVTESPARSVVEAFAVRPSMTIRPGSTPRCTTAPSTSRRLPG